MFGNGSSSSNGNDGSRIGGNTGVVKWFNRVKGWGFITPDGGGDEVFVHYSGIHGEGYRNLEEGDRVRYRLVDRGRGPQAQDVMVVRS